jgi:hypothetical protein
MWLEGQDLSHPLQLRSDVDKGGNDEWMSDHLPHGRSERTARPIGNSAFFE